VIQFWLYEILRFFKEYEAFAVWLEGIALLAILIWDVISDSQQHKQTLAQMEIIQNQARATEAAANAATKSAEALISSERAWVVAELIPICVKFGHWCRPAGNGWATLSNEEILNGEHLKHRLKLTNMGRTPATIITFELGHSPLGDEGINGPIGDIVKDIENNEFDRVISGGESIQDTVIDILQFRNKSIEKVGDSENCVGFYGLIKYRHVFSSVDIEEVSFRYLYSPVVQKLTRVSEFKTDKAKGTESAMGSKERGKRR
jgi:hypothetical protein